MKLTDPLTRIREGVVGQFTPVLDPAVEQFLGGSLRLDDAQITVKLLADRAISDRCREPDECQAVLGHTEAGEVLVAGFRSLRHDMFPMEVSHFMAKYLIVGLNLDDADGDLVSGVQFAYHGLRDWLEDRIYHDEPLQENGRYVGWKAELRYGTGTIAPLDDGFTLQVGSGWEVGGEFDRRTFTTPLMITVESDQRRPIGEHVLRLDAVHALLNLAHRDRVKSIGGSAKMTADSEWCGFWDSNMMAADTSAHRSTQSFPFFGLSDIGGVDTIAAWIRLVFAHRRAVLPLVRHVLVPNQTPEARLLSTAAAMESWVAAHRRTQEWAKKRNGEPLPGALVRQVDRSWDDWIGDPGKWLHAFWSSYRYLKHDPHADLDPHLLHILEGSGRWLLTAALLDHAAGSRGPSHHLFSSGLGMVGDEVRRAVSDIP